MLHCDDVHQGNKLDAVLGEVRRRSLAGAETAAVLQQLQVQLENASLLERTSVHRVVDFIDALFAE